MLSELLDDVASPISSAARPPGASAGIGERRLVKRLMQARSPTSIRPSASKRSKAWRPWGPPRRRSFWRGSTWTTQSDSRPAAAEALRQQQPCSKDRSRISSTNFVRHAPSPGRSGCSGTCLAIRSPQAIADLQQTTPALHYAISLLWSFVESWIARRWELHPGGVPSRAGTHDAV